MNQLANLFNRKSDIIRNTIDLSFSYVKFTPDGILTECNHNFAKLFGFESPSEIQGHHHSEFVDPEYAKTKEYQIFWTDLRSGLVKSGEFRRRNKHGGLVFISAAYTPQKKNGTVDSVIKIASDITDEKKNSHNFTAIKQSIDLSYGFIQFDTQGNILDANSIFTDTVGYELEEIIGRHHSIFVGNQYKDSEEYAEFWKSLREGEVQSGEFKRYSKEGKRIWLQSAYSPVIDIDGNITSVVKVATDITSKKEAADMARDLKITVDQSFGFIQFDSTGNILDVNDNFTHLMGYGSPTELIGKHHSLFVDHGYAKSSEYKDFWSNLRSNRKQQGQFKRFTKSGDEVWIQAAYTPILNDDGMVASVIKIAADVTSDKREAAQGRKDVKDVLLGNITEISSAIDEMSSGAREQSEKIDLSSSSLESSLESSETVARKAEQIANAAKKGKENSQKGSTYVRELVGTMGGLSKTAHQAHEAMENLAKGTEKINSILNIIQEIANNTNLLALNASIEAAQAGDAGRGFSVIAHEIRMLAENARDSVKEIENQISSMIVDTKEVSKNMQDVTQRVQQSEEATNNVNTIFNEIVVSNEQTSNLSSSIVADSNNQKEQLKQIVTNSESIVIISEQTAAGSEEVATATKALEKMVSSF